MLKLTYSIASPVYMVEKELQDLFDLLYHEKCLAIPDEPERERLRDHLLQLSVEAGEAQTVFIARVLTGVHLWRHMEDGLLVGVVTVVNTTSGQELGYAVRPEFWGQGHATNMLAQWVYEMTTGLGHWGVNDVLWLRVFADNIASLHVAEKIRGIENLGFDDSDVCKFRLSLTKARVQAQWPHIYSILIRLPGYRKGELVERVQKVEEETEEFLGECVKAVVSPARVRAEFADAYVTMLALAHEAGVDVVNDLNLSGALAEWLDRNEKRVP